MIALRIAVAADCFPGPLKQRIFRMAQAGAQGVQFDARSELKPADFSATGRRALLHQLADAGLKVAGLSLPTRRPLYDSQQLDARMNAVKGALQFAAQLKAAAVILSTGRIPEDAESADYKLLCQLLNDLARYGNHVGAALSLTPSSHSATTLSSLIERVTDGPVGVSFDPASFVMTGHDPVESLSQLHALVNHVRVRDALRDLNGNGIETPVGRGEVEWDHVLAIVAQADYSGWFTADRTTGEDRAGDVVRAVEFLKRLSME